MSIKQNITSLQDLLEAVNNLPDAGGVELPELANEGSASDLLSGKQLIDQDGNVVTGTIATKTASNLTASGATVTVPAGYYASQATKSVATATQATPSISVNSSGLITASATQSAGYVSAGTKTGTKQLTIQAAKTITPSTSSQTAVASGVYTTGAITVTGDANLKAENIAEGVSIFGVSGSYSGGTGGIDTSDATASADEIMSGETAYVNGSKVTGTFSIDSELNAQDDLISQIQTALASKKAGVILPTLFNPATAENLEEGYELIDGDGNIVVGTHVCSSGGGGGGDEESITFSVVNNLPDLISVYGKVCLPNETTVVTAPVDASQVYGMPITIWIGMFDGEWRDYYNNYYVYVSYPMEGEDGELYDESFGVCMMPQDAYPFCALGVTEVAPYGNECFTFYCEEV